MLRRLTIFGFATAVAMGLAPQPASVHNKSLTDTMLAQLADRAIEIGTEKVDGGPVVIVVPAFELHCGGDADCEDALEQYGCFEASEVTDGWVCHGPTFRKVWAERNI